LIVDTDRKEGIPSLSFGKRDVSLSMQKVNIMAIPVALLPLLTVGLPFLLIWGSSRLIIGARELFHWYVFLPALVVGVVAHEVIHGMSWALLGGKPMASIRFGMQWKVLTPYAHCSEPMPASVYKWGAAMPAIVLGMIPAFFGLAIGNGGWVLFGILFLVAATGDFIVLWMIRNVPANILVEDHPQRAGCYVYDVRSAGEQNSASPQK
jgi:hypothetical protein